MAELGRLLRAFLWLRWRMLAGSLGGRRRAGWRLLSAWLEAGGTLFLWVSSLGGVVGLSLGALVAGSVLAAGGSGRAFALLGVRLALGIVLLGFLMAPAVRGLRTGAGARMRLRLLPIENRSLFGLEVGAGLADPWLIMATPAPFVLGLVLAIRSNGSSGLLALAAAGGLFVCLIGVSAFWSFGLELLLRNRRRAEVLAVVFGFAVVAVSMVPALVDRHREREAEGAGRAAEEAVVDEVPAEGRPDADQLFEEALSEMATPGAWTAAVPSEAFALCLALGTEGRIGAAAGAAGLLWIEALALLGLSYLLWRRLVTGVAESGGPRGAAERVAIPEVGGLSPQVAAVAWAQVRHGLRTLPGRSATVMPTVMVVFVAFLAGPEWAPRLGEGGPSPVLAGALLAVAGVGMGLLALQALMFNQLAVDGTGLLLELVGPVSDRDLTAGKAWGLGVLCAFATVPATTAAMVLRPAALPLWPALLALAVSAFCLSAPVAATVSALLPRAVDPGKFGGESQPHQLAGLGGMLTTALALLPGFVLGAVAWYVGESATIVAVVEGVWAGVSVILCRYGLRLAAAVLARRRESVYLALKDGA